MKYLNEFDFCDKLNQDYIIFCSDGTCNAYGYDRNVNRTFKETISGRTEYEYDSRNRLEMVRYPDRWEKFGYDLAGNRKSRATGEGEERYTYDARNRLQQVVRTASNSMPLLAEGIQNGTVEDGYGTVKAGEEVWKYEYGRQGNLIKVQEEVNNRFLYVGQQYDAVTMQYYLRARYYNPVVARFTQEDTYRGDGLNLYAYCQNNPVGYYDPSGHGTCGDSKSGSEASRTNWGPEHGKGNVKHNNAIETELDNAAANGATDIRKNRVQRDSNGNRVYAPDGKYTQPDASYVIDGQRYNTNYISNYELDDISELNRKIEAFNRMCDADPEAITQLIFKY